MEAWPDEELEERVDDIAKAAEALLRDQAAWRHRRVETLTVLSHDQVRRSVSVDFTVPAEWRERLRLSAAGEYVVPLALVAKRSLVHFDLRNEEGHSVPLLTAEQNTLIGRELLLAVLEDELTDRVVDDATWNAVEAAASPVIEAALAERAPPGTIDRLVRDHGLEPLDAFRDMLETLSSSFVLWAVVRGIDRRRVLKFAYDEPTESRPGFGHVYAAPGCAEAGSYHLEVAVPVELKARTTVLRDEASGEELAVGARDSDRPSVYLTAEPSQAPVQPRVAVVYGAERGRFLVPAAIAATVITLLLALPALLADLETLAGSAGPAIALVLSTSAVFSALVLRTDEHPLVRLMLVRSRLCLVAGALAALFAAAALGFQATAWLLHAVWALAALASAVAAGILVVEAVRSPSERGSYPWSEP